MCHRGVPPLRGFGLYTGATQGDARSSLCPGLACVGPSARKTAPRRLFPKISNRPNFRTPPWAGLVWAVGPWRTSALKVRDKLYETFGPAISSGLLARQGSAGSFFCGGEAGNGRRGGVMFPGKGPDFPDAPVTCPGAAHHGVHLFDCAGYFYQPAAQKSRPPFKAAEGCRIVPPASAPAPSSIPRTGVFSDAPLESTPCP